MAISCIIVDDEPHARRYLKELLEKDSEVEIKAIFHNGREAIEFLKQGDSDLLFLDIHMPGIDGMTVAKLLTGNPTLIIFTTAFDHHAAEAFEVEAFDYLLKPFDDKRLENVLSRVKEHLKKSKELELSSKVQELYQEYRDSSSPHLTSLEIKERGLIRKIQLKDVICFESSSVYILIHEQSKKSLYRTSMNLLEHQISPEEFVRIHRSFIINRKLVSNVTYLNNSTFKFEMKNGATFTSSRSYYDRINKVFD